MYKLRIIGDIGFEVWADIEGYEGLYKVSTYGRVKSCDRYVPNHSKLQFIEGHIMKDCGNSNSKHRKLTLVKDGVDKKEYVHRLVAKAFIPNYENKLEINHKDENPENNNVGNLEWVTHKENNLYGTKIERQRQKMIGCPFYGNQYIKIAR